MLILQKTSLARQVLERAHADRFELAWRPLDIPAVIDAIRDADLVSLGGDPQFRFPDGSVAELPDHGIDITCVENTRLSWARQVTDSANEAMSLIGEISPEALVEQGWSRFYLAFSEQKAAGFDPADHLYITWESAGRVMPDPDIKPFSAREHGLPSRKWLTPDRTRKAGSLSFLGLY